MKISVIAANGKSGRAFVAAALEAGHEVTAGVHAHNSLPSHPKLTVVSCDARQPGDVEKLIKGQDAVVSLIGHGYKRLGDVQTTAIANVLKSIKPNQKLISLTGSGVRVEGDNISLFDRMLNFFLQIALKEMVDDGIGHFRLLQNSSANWTVIRALILTNGPAEPFQLTLNGPTKYLVPRASIAQAVLQILKDNSFKQQAPIIGRAE